MASLEKTSTNSENSLGKTIGGFAFFCASGKFYSSGKSGHHWGSQNKAGISLNNPLEGSISFGLGDKLVFSFVV